jgi:hypothetical protein
MKTAFANNQKDDGESVLPATAAWAKSVPISLRNNQQFPLLSQSHGSSEFDEQPEESESVPESVNPLGSAVLGGESRVPDVSDPWSLKKASFNLHPRYNGLFDPFGSDRLLNTLLSIVAEKTPENKNPSTNSNPQDMSKKSRYERLFDNSGFESNVSFVLL